MNSLWARKPIADAVPEGHEGKGMQRTLGTKDLIALSIGAVIGAGIFSTLGTAAAGSIGARLSTSRASLTTPRRRRACRRNA